MQRLVLATPPSDRYSSVQWGREGGGRTSQGGGGVLHSKSGCNGRDYGLGRGAGDGMGAARCGNMDWEGALGGSKRRRTMLRSHTPAPCQRAAGSGRLRDRLVGSE